MVYKLKLIIILAVIIIADTTYDTHALTEPKIMYRAMWYGHGVKI